MTTSRGLRWEKIILKLRNPFRKESGFLVLDIGSSSIKLADVHHGPGGPCLTALGVVPLPATVIQSNVIQDEGPVVEAIRRLRTSTGAQSTQVITAVPGPAVIVKKVDAQTRAKTAINELLRGE